jgi:DNA-binding winged helix-turn-helix (wHTH) protein/TolB-like protein/tetratricopeptide (TPR) repeat protein
MSQSRVRFYEFSHFRLDTVNRLLLRQGEAVQLTAKAFDILLILIQNGGQVISKEELMDKVWQDTIVEEINLTVHISALRKIFGENPNEHKYIITVPKRGYGFVAEVTAISDSNLSVRENNGHSEVKPEQPTPQKPQEETQESLPVALAEPPGHFVRSRTRTLFISGLLVLICAVVLLIASMIYRKNSPSLMPPKSIAVLPFSTFNANDEEYSGLGMADALITRLSNQKVIRVMPTSTIVSYAGQTPDSLLIGRKLGVEAVIQGTIQRDEKSVRVTVQLIHTGSGSSMWAERFDENNTGVFAVQDSISRQITQALMLTLNEQVNAPQPKGETTNPETHHAYLRGIYFWNKRSNEGLQKARQYFQQAIEQDRGYGRAYAMLADTFYLLAYHTDDKAEKKRFFENAKQAALQAIEIDETIAEAHTALAMVRSHYDNDMSAAEKEHERAIELNPNYATAHQRYGWYLHRHGQLQRAAQEFQLAVELDPLSVANTTVWANMLYNLKQFDQAIEQGMKALELDTEFGLAHLYIALSYEQKQMYDKALEHAYKCAEKDRLSILDLEVIGHIYAVSGQKAEAQKCIQELHSYVPEDKTALYSIAIIYEGLGKRDEAIAWLKKASLGNARPNMPLSYDPRCESLLSDKRFLEFQ